jgi:nucleoside-diphosphate-sugar epimerase
LTPGNSANPLAAELDEVLARTGDLWDGLRGARIFITGGTGFFGCWLLETLLWANDRRALGASAVVLSRNPDAFVTKAPHLARHPAITLHRGDVRSFPFPGGGFSHVVHAGMDASTGLDAREPRLMWDMMVNGTARVLELAHSAGATRFLLTSSGSVYGRQLPVDFVTEDYPAAPDSSSAPVMHGEAKRASEMLCAINADATLQPTVARCFAFVGPYLPIDVHFAIGNFIRDALAGGPIRVAGDGTAIRSYLYAADLAMWLWTILLRGRTMRPYNVGSNEAITIRALAELIRDTLAPGVPIEVARTPIPGVPVSRYVPSVERASGELELVPSVHLREAVARTARFARQYWTPRHHDPIHPD